MAKQNEMCIGDVYMMQFTGCGNEQSGLRPGLVFQNNKGNMHSPNIIALPLTSSIKKAAQPTHVLLPAVECGLSKTSMVLCENPERMSKDRIGRYITTLPKKYMKCVAEASILASSVISFIDAESLTAIWERAVRLNSK